MKLENSFSLRAPIDEVWAALLDVERVAPCVPGARLVEPKGDDVYSLAVDLTLGATSVCYEGQVEIVEQGTGDRRAVLSVTAAEAEGEGRAEARLVLSVAEQGKLTEATLTSEVSLSGEALAAGPGAIRGAAERLVDDFARNLAAMLGGGVATVNGADPASSTAPTPVSVGDVPLRSQPTRVGPAAPAPARAETGEPRPGAGETPREAPPVQTPTSSSEGSWAGASRQAGATIERLRSPLGATLLALVLLGALVGRRRRARGAEPEPDGDGASDTAPTTSTPAPGSAA